MPENNGTAETPETPASPEATPEGTASTTTPPAEGKAPKIEGEYDQERAVALIAKLRGEIAELKAKPAAPKPPAGDDMAARLAALEADLAAERHKATTASVSAETGVPAELLVGDTADALKAHAERLLEWAKSHATPGSDIPAKPRAALTPGHGGDTEPAFDPVAVARAARNQL